MEHLTLRFAGDVMDEADETAISHIKNATLGPSLFGTNSSGTEPNELQEDLIASLESSQLAGMLVDPQMIRTRLQQTWTLFSRLSDGDKIRYLRGVVSQCGPLQVEAVCTMLNLKMSANVRLCYYSNTAF
jgi:hypothetical protein